MKDKSIGVSFEEKYRIEKEFYSKFDNDALIEKIMHEIESIEVNQSMIDNSKFDIEVCKDV